MDDFEDNLKRIDRNLLVLKIAVCVSAVATLISVADTVYRVALSP